MPVPEKALFVPPPKKTTKHFAPPSSSTTNASSSSMWAGFDLVNIDLCIVNSLRRSIMSSVNTAAFPFDPTWSGPLVDGGIVIHDNSSVLHNEMVGHRISLVPLCLTPNELRNFDPRNYQCTLKVKNTGNTIVDVTSRDIAVSNMTGAAVPKALRDRLFPSCEITHDHILLVRVKPNTICDGSGEALHFSCVPRLGCGKDHARWSPVSACYFRYMDKKGEVGEQQVDVEPIDFHFFLECINPNCSPYFLVFLAFTTLIDRLDRITGAVRDGSMRFEVVHDEERKDSFVIIIEGEDHTIGNLMQSLLYNKWLLDENAGRIIYVGYFKRHPLTDDITLRIQVKDPSTSLDGVQSMFIEGLGSITEKLTELTLEWIEFSGIGGFKFVSVDEFVMRHNWAGLKNKNKSMAIN